MQGENRKLQYHIALGQMAAGANFRSVGLKQIDQWQAMFPTMFDGALSTTPLVSESSGQRISTVFTCLNVRGETIGSLPFSVKRNETSGAVTDYNNSVHRLIHDRPNEYTTAFTFWATIEKIKLAWGNAFVEIKRSGSVPVGLYILKSCDVSMKKTPSGEIYYEYAGRLLRSTDVLHFKNYSEDGLCGVSTIRQNALTLGTALKLNQYNNSLIGERPYGYLTSEKRPKDLQQKGNVRSLWDKRDAESDEKDPADTTKAKTIAGIPYLYGGLEFKSFTLPADDVAYIESAKLKDQDIYGMFRVPPTLAENYEKAPYNSSEQQDIVFVKYSLASIRDIEQECTEKLFPESNKQTGLFYCKFNLNGLLRGDMKTRQEFYSGLFNVGAITPNQICELEDLPTYGKPGDQHFIQLNMIPVDKIADYVMAQTAKPQPAATREEIMEELRQTLKSKLNGHYKEVAEYLN